MYSGGGGSGEAKQTDVREVAVDPVEEYLKMQAAETNSSSDKKFSFGLTQYKTLPIRFKSNNVSKSTSKLNKAVSGSLACVYMYNWQFIYLFWLL